MKQIEKIRKTNKRADTNFALKIQTFLLIAVCSLIWTSCQSTLKVSFARSEKNQSSSEANLSFETKFGPVFEDTILAISKNSIDENEKQSGSIFETEEIRKELLKSGFGKAYVFSKNSSELKIDLSSSKMKDDPAWKSGILFSDYKTGKKGICFSKTNLKKVYDNLPAIFKSYIDLFGAPVWTDEEMTDEEYIDMIASVYGQPLADEIASSELKIVADNGKTVSVPMIRLLNLKDEIKINW